MNVTRVQLGEVCDRQIQILNPRQTPDCEFRYVDISAVNNKSKRIEQPQITRGKNTSVRARQVIRQGDVLVATTRPNLNAVAQVSISLDGEICSTGFCVLRPGPSLDSDYLFCVVRSPQFVKSLTDLVRGALYPAVTDRQIFEQWLILPDISEQQRIAARVKEQLAAVEAARAAADVQQYEMEALEHAVFCTEMQALEDAPMEPLGNLTATASGTTPNRDRPEFWTAGTIPWVKTGEIRWNDIFDTEEKVTPAALARCSLPMLPPGTVLIAMYGQGKTRGQSAVLRIPATTNQACLAALPNENIDADFLCFWLRHNYQELRALSEGRGGNQANLNGLVLRSFRVPRLPVGRQREIAVRIRIALSEINLARTATSTLRKELDALPSRILAEAFA